MASNTGFIYSSDHTQIFFRYYPVRPKKATVLIIHGFGEHGGRYAHVAEKLLQQNYEVMSIDLRGHGNSGGPRGHIVSFDQFEQDVYAGIRHAQENNSPKIFILAHSMGALVALRTVSIHKIILNGLVLSAPLFDVKIPIPAWKKIGAQLFSRFLPTIRVVSNIQASDLSSDNYFVSNYERDPLILKNLSISAFREITKSYKNIQKITQKFNTPLFLQLAGNDKVVNSEAAKKWFNKIKKHSKDVSLKCYPDFLHEIYNEAERDKPIQDCVSWLNKRA